MGHGMTAKGKTTATGVDYPIRCRSCALYYDKGSKPQKGQDDSLFMCDACQENVDAAAAKASKSK